MANSYLSRTPSSASNRRTWTWSSWIKLGAVSGDRCIFSASTDASNRNAINLSNEGYFIFDYEVGGTRNVLSSQNATYRDISGWYHLVVAVDTTQATDTNRVKMYVNGSQITLTGVVNNYPSQNADMFVNNNIGHAIGKQNWDTAYHDGYMSHVAFVDGQALAPTVFGETDSTSGIWKFKNPTGVTWGTNGFHLKFENSGNLGLDSSGNSNTFTVNGDGRQALDTPSNVHATLNALDATSQTLSHGNLSGYGVTNKTSTATLGFDKGKWYWECKCVTQNTYTMIVGITNQTNIENGSYNSGNVGTNANGWSYFMQSNQDNGKAFNNNTLSSVYQTISQGDILQIAVDADAGKIWWGVNGTYVNSGNPATGTNAVYTNVSTDQMLFPAYSVYAGSGGTPLVSFNFGNGYFGTTAISSAGSNGNGSLFEYDVPSGYYALNTKNINTYG